MSAQWLSDAVFYEIYPQSFRDTNGDGIGDIPGIVEKLPYVKSLGCNAIWLNPCFDSPFKDAGYDVRDYYKVAPRYGTNDDLANLFREAHRQGIRILLDLVPGHTSEEHQWFLESAKVEKNEMSGRFIWTDSVWTRGDNMIAISGEFPRDGAYIINFFKCQPALNYGYSDRRQSWQQSIDSPDALATREAIKDIIRFWLDMGCDGFRVDMAGSLVKNDDPDKLGTRAVWKDILGTIHREYPEAAFISEWNVPTHALDCGFDMDFVLDWEGNGYNIMTRAVVKNADGTRTPNAYFNLHSGRGADEFLADYLPDYYRTRSKGHWCFITCNHDTPRTSAFLDETERRLAFAWIFTMPGVPFLYYGDEIGMDFRPMASKEGGFNRTGTRTPMQWDEGKNLGFSDGSADSLYLPVESGTEHTVSVQEKDPGSMLNFVRSLIAMRHSLEDLHSGSPFTLYASQGRVLAYKRGDLLIAMNPGEDAERLTLDKKYTVHFAIGAPEISGDTLTLPSQSFALLTPAEK